MNPKILPPGGFARRVKTPDRPRRRTGKLFGMTTPADVLDFWLGAPATTPAELGEKMRRWYDGGPELDRSTVSRFGADTQSAIEGGLREWLTQPKGWLALIIVIDQFSRSVYRGSPRAFAGDARAVETTLEALESKKDDALTHEERQFALMPLLHSEVAAHQTRAVAELARHVARCPVDLQPVFSMGLEQARKYQSIVERFGRFPHRNAVLGRESTPEELEFLKEWEAKKRPAGTESPPSM